MSKKAKLADLKASPRNPRKITDEKLGMLKAALDEFGDLGGIVFNRRTERLVGGHQRQKLLPADAEIKISKSYETPTPKGTVADGYVLLDGERFSYREVDWPEDRELAANIAANKGGGDWDLPMLSEIILELDAANFDLNLTMFDEAERENLVVPVQHIPPEGDPDHIPSTPVEPTAKRGDIWILGNHRLMCGDSAAITEIDQLMGGIKADALITDPPYGISYQSNYRKEKFSVIANDEKVLEEWVGCAELKVSGWVIFFVGWQRLAEWLRVGSGFGDLTNILIWRKAAAMGDLQGSFSPTYELALAYNRGAKLDPAAGRPSAIFECNIESPENFVHPTQKPVFLLESIISAVPSKTVLDLFGGSGSTLIACEKTGRQCFMMELDPRYIDVIVKRWETYTGKTAELLKS